MAIHFSLDTFSFLLTTIVSIFIHIYLGETEVYFFIFNLLSAVEETLVDLRAWLLPFRGKHKRLHKLIKTFIPLELVTVNKSW
jgi:hypothetical protein